MPETPIQIKRYSNRRFYARDASKYVSLQEIESFILSGKKVEIRDSQTGEDLTRPVLTQLLLERQPEKIALFPTDMLHFILRSNDVMADFLRDYFHHSLTYLDFLQRHGASAATTLTRPMHWVKAWLDGIRPGTATADEEDWSAAEDVDQTAARIERLETRIRQLEARADEMDRESVTSGSTEML